MLLCIHNTTRSYMYVQSKTTVKRHLGTVLQRIFFVFSMTTIHEHLCTLRIRNITQLYSVTSGVFFFFSNRRKKNLKKQRSKVKKTSMQTNTGERRGGVQIFLNGEVMTTC